MPSKPLNPLESNILTDPLVSPHVRSQHDGPYISEETSRTRQMQVISEEREKKAAFLFERYHIDANIKDCWKELALALAIEYCPGFQSREKQGAPRKITVQVLSDLYRFFIYERARINQNRRIGSKLSDAAVCDSISGAKKIGKIIPSLGSVSSKRLRNLVSEAIAMRRKYVTFVIRDIARGKSEQDLGWFFNGDPPSWRNNYPEK